MCHSRQSRFFTLTLLPLVILLFFPGAASAEEKSEAEVARTYQRIVEGTLDPASLSSAEVTEIIQYALDNYVPPPGSYDLSVFDEAMPPETCCVIPGDADGSGGPNFGDVTFLIKTIFQGGPLPPCIGQGDPNGDCSIGISDVFYLMNSIFGGGPAPVCGACDSMIAGGTLQDPGDSLIIRPEGPLVCDQSNPISVKAHTLTDVSSIGIALELIHSGGMTIDSIIQITPNATMVSDIAQDGVSPDTLDFGWIRAIPSVPAFSGETIATIWVTPVTGDPFEFREINDLIQKTRYTGPSNLEEFLLPLKTEIMSAGCAGQISLSPDPKLLICPGGDAAFRVQVLDDLGDPVAGNNSVSVELVTCGGLYGCSNGPGIINLLPVAPSDIDGFVTFYAEGGGCDAACMANVKLGGITWARVPVLTFDINSDTLVSVGDFAWDPTCNDYDPTPGITIEDFNAWNPHLGHHCDLDPCERFSAEFTVTPSSNLSPGQVVTLDLELSNNSFDPCFIGLVGFFNSGFGDGEEDILFDNVVFNDTLHPGEAHTISVPFTIPGAGAGCFSTNFLTQAPCCDTAISLRHCAVSTQHCTRDVNLCYEQRISLSKFPVDSFVIIDDFLPNPTWQIVPLNLPATPLNSADTIVYEVCTPPLASLGDSAVAVVYVYSEGRLIPEVFETEVFVTSRTGDANGDCRVNIADITYMIARLFAAGPDAIPPEAGDPNCSGSLNVADITYLIALIFAGGPAPCVK